MPALLNQNLEGWAPEYVFLQSSLDVSDNLVCFISAVLKLFCLGATLHS